MIIVREIEMKEASPTRNDRAGPTSVNSDCISTVIRQATAVGAVPTLKESTDLNRQRRTPRERPERQYWHFQSLVRGLFQRVNYAFFLTGKGHAPG